MPLSYNNPSIEISPEEHDQNAIFEGSTESDVSAVLNILHDEGITDGPVLDLACGSGRHVRAFNQHFECLGYDIDQRMIDKAITLDSENPERYVCIDGSQLKDEGTFAAITLFNQSLVCFHSQEQAWGLFSGVAKALKPGGLFIIDNCCTGLWQQVKDGHFADGISEDGHEQLIFLPGENRFVWRRGDDVDENNWEISDKDRLYRLWSLNEIALAAAGVGLASRRLDHDTEFLVLQRPEG